MATRSLNLFFHKGSKGNFDVNTFARKYFSGGGHFNAAGGRDGDSLQDTIKKFKLAIQENSAQLQ